MFTMSLNFDFIDPNKLQTEKQIFEDVSDYLDYSDEDSKYDIFITAINGSFADAGAKFEINGFNIDFENYIYYFSDIYVDFKNIIGLIENKLDGELFFSEQGSLRKIKFIYSDNDNYKLFCEDEIIRKKIGNEEYILVDNFIHILKNLENKYVEKLKQYYPSIYANYLSRIQVN